VTYRLSFLHVSGLLALGLLSLPALAAGTQVAASQPPGRHAATSRLDQAVGQSKARVAQLRQGVTQQESRSRQANARLQQQDSTIAELKRQLQALRASQKPGVAGH
jgi:septal ring factor EnvC (AmiA/AmiB activator)